MLNTHIITANQLMKLRSSPVCVAKANLVGNRNATKGTVKDAMKKPPKIARNDLENTISR